jgi:hypothetical protein
MATLSQTRESGFKTNNRAVAVVSIPKIPGNRVPPWVDFGMGNSKSMNTCCMTRRPLGVRSTDPDRMY